MYGLKKTKACHLASYLLIAVLCASFAASAAPKIRKSPGLEALEQINEAMAETIDGVLPTVVNIRSQKKQVVTNPFEGTPFEDILPWKRGQQPRLAMSLGSGIIIDGKKGYILTNNHVVEGADQIYVDFFDLDGTHQEFEGEAFPDVKTELALVKIKDMEGKVLPEATLGDSDSLRVGHQVMAIGSPFQKAQSVSRGIVSALGRQEFGPQFERTIYQDFIQTDAAINQGNSGGPLLNIYGEVIGINTFIYSTSQGAQGVGFAIPVNLAKPVIEQLIAKGKVIRPYLGVLMTEVKRLDEEEVEALELEEPRGVKVVKVFPDSPAAKAGIQQFDILLEFDGDPIETSKGLQQQVLEKEVGETVNVELWRPAQKETMMVEVKLAQQPDDSYEVAKGGPGEGAERLGMTLSPVTEDMAKTLGLEQAKGLVVEKVADDSQAAREGIVPGDVIAEAKWQEVNSVHDLDKVIEQVRQENKTNLLLTMIRRSTKFLVVLDVTAE